MSNLNPEVAALLAKMSAADKEVLNKNFGIKSLSSALVPEHTRLKLDSFYSVSPEIDTLKTLVGKLCHVSDPVLITGPSGVGKKIIAEALHGSRKGAFITINCSSLPDYLLESELFGHEIGSFTGAERTTKGLLVAANDGTVLLDEIGDMPISLQAKLLVVLDEMKVRAVGATEYKKINCRFIAATRQSIENIREDLYYRLSTFELAISPLAHRIADIPLLVRRFDEECLLSDEEQAALVAHLQSTPLLGNVREVKREVKRAVFNKQIV